MANEGPSTERELILVAKPEAALRARREGVSSAAGADVSSLSDLLASEGATIRPLYGMSEERMKARTESMAEMPDTVVPDLSLYYRVEAPDERLDELAERLRAEDMVETAYVKPGAEPPQRLNDMAPRAEEPPQHTPDFTGRQGYLDPAPGGIDARYAWTLAGGEGAGVRIIDIEGAWRFTHEDLLWNQGGVIGGTQSTDLVWRDHGTAVVGEIGGDRNTLGVTGICADANVRAISIFGPGSGKAIRDAADALSAGDIILIELHRPGPRHNFQDRDDQRGYIAIEWWPDDFDAIRYATGRGVIVVEAAGNGAENLDDALYDTRPTGFPTTWTNPFNRANRDSGAIVVGAGAPPPNTHGQNHGPDRSRLDFSNWGALIDVQGWGREVTTAGYGDLQGGTNEDEWYTDQFSGTSSSSPIVVGALGCLQGVVSAAGQAPRTPAQARALLRATGSAQQDAPGRPASQRIGNRPDLRQLIARALKTKEKEKDKDKDRKDFKDRKEAAKEKETIKDKDIIKDKDRKEKEKEQKDVKDKEKEIKEVKDKEKEKEKDRKDKEKETKEIKDKEKEVKDKEKEKDKDRKDLKDRKEAAKEKEVAKDFEGFVEAGQEEYGYGPQAEFAAQGEGDLAEVVRRLEERVQFLEQYLAVGETFVASPERPDVGGGMIDNPEGT